ncbi:MAG: choice-of-anchor Q domain-containing protein, partial [Polyangiales bacterium]
VPDPMLGPLADNGGPTETHALEEGSPAINQIPAADCVDEEGEPLTTDQRGLARPQGDSCDVGAFELEVLP